MAPWVIYLLHKHQEQSLGPQNLCKAGSIHTPFLYPCKVGHMHAHIHTPDHTISHHTSFYFESWKSTPVGDADAVAPIYENVILFTYHSKVHG